MRDPDEYVTKDSEGWWFWNETWSEKYGPFVSEKEAERELSLYIYFNIK